MKLPIELTERERNLVFMFVSGVALGIAIVGVLSQTTLIGF